MSLTIRNAKILKDGSELVTNIFCDKGIITSIGEFVEADTIVDAAGKWVLPGIIDPHVHFRDLEQTNREDWNSASRAAVSAGVTTVLDMPNNSPSCTTEDILNIKREKALGNFVNFGFHMGAGNDNCATVGLTKGIASVKVYVGSSTGNLLVDDTASLLQILSSSRIMMVHAEDESLVQYYTQKAIEEGNESHVAARPNVCAEVCVQRLLTLARHTGGTLYIAHVTTPEEIALITQAKAQNVTVYAETCPHHLFLTEESAPGTIGKVNPPLRTQADVDAVWDAVLTGVIDTVGSDHAPHLFSDKQKPFFKAPAGIAGIETMLPLMLNSVNEGKLTMSDIIRLMCHNPASIFGIKNKGFIEEGYDADLVIVDMELAKKVNAAQFYSKAQFSPFDGMELTGWPVCTIVAGTVAYESGTFGEPCGKEVHYNDS